jgi:N-acetylneuraminic acid mutarotase
MLSRKGRTKSIVKSAIFSLSMLTLLSACGRDDKAPPVSNLGWTWVSGSNISGQAGAYGTKGTPAPSNIPGGRWRAAYWLDSSGNFWLFGGESRDSAGSLGLLNDLWKYDPIHNEWTWVSGANIAHQAGVYGTKGIPAPSNIPGARYSAVSWLDPNGNLWLFGGEGFVTAGNFGKLNDLWKYDPTSNEWTWISGSNSLSQAGIYGTKGVSDPSNVPGAREFAASWVDADGDLWLFGGDGYDSVGYYPDSLNDLWKFDPANLEWTWVSGANIAYQAGVYGTIGTPALANVPGARSWPLSWLGSSSKLCIFGGIGLDSLGNQGWLNDLWEYNPVTREWAWISGSNIGGQAGVYGTKGTAGPLNVPGGRCEALSWFDSNGKLWLFGGAGIDSAGFSGTSLNDLWRYDPIMLEWTWISGNNIAGQPGIYGTKGLVDPMNVPGARNGAVSWVDSQDNLWIFGGYGFDSVGQNGRLNDLWRFKW